VLSREVERGLFGGGHLEVEVTENPGRREGVVERRKVFWELANCLWTITIQSSSRDRPLAFSSVSDFLFFLENWITANRHNLQGVG
jgi:hypothetical protein